MDRTETGKEKDTGTQAQTYAAPDGGEMRNDDSAAEPAAGDDKKETPAALRLGGGDMDPVALVLLLGVTVFGFFYVLFVLVVGFLGVTAFAHADGVTALQSLQAFCLKLTAWVPAPVVRFAAGIPGWAWFVVAGLCVLFAVAVLFTLMAVLMLLRKKRDGEEAAAADDDAQPEAEK